MHASRKGLTVLLMLGRASHGHCSAGGTSIEELAEKMPEKIVKIPVDKRKGLSSEQAQQMVKGLGVSGDKQDAARQISSLYDLFVKSDCTMVEVWAPCHSRNSRAPEHDRGCANQDPIVMDTHSARRCLQLQQHAQHAAGCGAVCVMSSGSMLKRPWQEESCSWWQKAAALAVPDLMVRPCLRQGALAGEPSGRDQGWQAHSSRRQDGL